MSNKKTESKPFLLSHEEFAEIENLTQTVEKTCDKLRYLLQKMYFEHANNQND